MESEKIANIQTWKETPILLEIPPEIFLQVQSSHRKKAIESYEDDILYSVGETRQKSNNIQTWTSSAGKGNVSQLIY